MVTMVFSVVCTVSVVFLVNEWRNSPEQRADSVRSVTRPWIARQVLKILRSTLPAGAPSSSIGPETAERLIAAAQAVVAHQGREKRRAMCEELPQPPRA